MDGFGVSALLKIPARPSGRLAAPWRSLGLCLGLLLGLGLAWAPAAQAETVALPITLEYPTLRNLMVQQSFPEPGEKATVLNQFGGCTLIELSQPEVAPERDLLRVRCAIKVRVGVSVAGRCLNPVDWNGFIDLVQRPSLTPRTWQLVFHTLESRLYNRDGQPAEVAQTMWDLIKQHVHAYLDRQTIDLAPPMKDLQAFLPLLMDQESQPRMQAWMKSIRPGPITITPLALKANILMDVAPQGPQEQERLSISSHELQRFVDAWQAWDSYLVYQINYLGRQPLTAQEQRLLLDTLLETRYRFVNELNQDNPGRGDVVREQFALAWQRLAPILRRHLEADHQRASLDYLGFFTAADALEALDKLGPTLGVDVSRNGLIRLARLLEGQDGYGPNLEYNQAVDTTLRRTLGLGPALQVAGPAYGAQELPWSPPPPSQDPTAGQPDSDQDPAPLPQDPPELMAPPADRGPVSWLLRWLSPPAWAADSGQPPNAQEIKPWVLAGSNRELYRERFREAIRVGVRKTLEARPLDSRYHDMFHDLVTSTAWQESCWRQFITTGSKVTYLRSYNNSSVGVMQINERVWRGMYNLPSLRWNVLYNIRAGCEILELYTREYALEGSPRVRALEQGTLIKAIYAMYNGGPAQFERYLKRQSSGSLMVSDKLFAEKYNWVKGGQWDKLDRCWGD